MTSNDFSVISSWSESDHYFIYRYRIGSPITYLIDFRVRVSDEGTIEEVQLQDLQEFSPLPPQELFVLLNDTIREYNARL